MVLLPRRRGSRRGRLDRTITDEDLDIAWARIWQGFREETRDAEPDLCVDGLSESLLMRLVRHLTIRRGA